MYLRNQFNFMQLIKLNKIFILLYKFDVKIDYIFINVIII